MLSGFAVKLVQKSPKQKMFRVELGHGNAISIETYKDFVATNIKVNYAAQFLGAYGLMGTYPTGEKIARDGSTTMEDPIAFGQEWQVLESEPKLFHSMEGPQHPEACAMPETTASAKQRRLGE